MSLKTILLVVGLVAGAAIGWFTAPKPAAEMKAGPINVTVQPGNNGAGSSMTVTGNDGGLKVEVGQPSPLDDPGLRTAIFAAVCAVIGLGAGYLIEMRKG
jgi:hypothetical protein